MEGLVKNNEVLGKLLSFAVDMYKNYKNVPYHSFYHAMDVTYMTYYLLTDMGLYEQLALKKTDLATLLLAALGHDVLHPGNNNLYQINCKSAPAIQYHNESVLENVSSAFVQKSLIHHHFLKGLELDEVAPVESILKNIHELILRTDMNYHFRLLQVLVELGETKENQESTSPKRDTLLKETLLKTKPIHASTSFHSVNELSVIELKSPKEKLDIMCAILHAAGCFY